MNPEKQTPLHPKPHTHDQDPPLGGTFISVLFVAAFIAVSWFGVWLLFTSKL